MSDTTIPRQPWLGLAALAIAAGMAAAIWFLTTPEGQHWTEDLLRPFGHAAILAFVLAPVLFFGAAAFVLLLAIAAVRRREPFRFGELALAIFLALWFQIGDQNPQHWSGFPRHLCFAAVLVFAVSWAARRLLRHVRPSS